jgi:ATP-dependent DNA helicase DinG
LTSAQDLVQVPVPLPLEADRTVYVAIDLETTGLKAKQDAIIEIGAVRFTCDPYSSGEVHVLDRFVTFVNPGRPIPLRIQQLTGITNADVVDAPHLDHVGPEVLSFVGSDTRYTVAHNAGFDAGFLRAGGIEFNRPMQDTFELATILLPGVPSYSLGELARVLDISLPDAHRALDDAEATARLFGILLYQAAQLRPGISRILLSAGRHADWPPNFLLSDLAVHRSEPIEAPKAGSEYAVASAEPVNQDIRIRSQAAAAQSRPRPPDVVTFYVPGGSLNELLDTHYEYRAGQTEMSQRVMDALATGDHLLIEAGTGTGKTLAYLLPAALYATQNSDRVVVATNTIALQDQILEKELPMVSNLLQLSGVAAPRSALLKGRSNYLCTRRLYQWYRKRALSRQELSLLAKILVWLQATQTGDVGELFMPTVVEQALWQHVMSDGASCAPGRCAARCTGDQDVLGNHFVDYFHRALRNAEEAHILVVNHALLLTDMESGGRILPQYENLIVDEAHRFEEAATDILTFRADWKTVHRWLGDLQIDGELCKQLSGACAQARDHDARAHVTRIADLARTADNAVRNFADALLTFLKNHETIRTDSGYTQRIAIDTAFRSQPAWSELEIHWERVSRTLCAVIDEAQRLAAELAEKEWWRTEPHSSYLAELSGLKQCLEDTTATLDHIIFGNGEIQSGKLVSWAEVEDQARDARLVCAPVYVSDRLERDLIHSKRSVVFTGATLRTGSGFSFIRDRLGLWDVDAATVDSPFDYERSTLLFMPSDLPDPRSSHYQHAVEHAIIDAATAANGSTVALFTSYAQLRVTADAIRAPLDHAGITVLQHGSSSRRRLLREYRHTERAVLLGTRSFWEGIDLPGDELTCLLIVRLPFAVPSDPLVAARAADLENAFRDYTLPDAILRFRQGFGRLIRRSSDRGVVVLLDNRVWRKDYGKAFQESLPPCTQRHAPLDTLGNDVSDWLYAKGDED